MEVSDFINTSPMNHLMTLLELAFPGHLPICVGNVPILKTEDAQPPGTANQTSDSWSYLPTKQSYHDAPPLTWFYNMLLEWMLKAMCSKADNAV